MIERAVRRARVNDVADRIHLEEMSFEDLRYPDAFFDVVAGFGVLHHVDLDGARDSLHRVLKPGGLAVFNEPLGHNLPLEFARKYLPYPRKKEHATDIPLKIKDIERFAAPFERYVVTPFYFFSMLEQAIGRPLANSPLRRLDGAIAGRFPRLGRFYRMATIALYR
jgi:SAM-dependent methyltransferase